MKAFLKNFLNVELADEIMNELDSQIQKFKITSDPVLFRDSLKSTDKKIYDSELGHTQEIRSFEYVIMGNRLMTVNPGYFDENSISVLQKNTNTIVRRKFNGDIVSDHWDYFIVIYIPPKFCQKIS